MKAHAELKFTKERPDGEILNSSGIIAAARYSLITKVLAGGRKTHRLRAFSVKTRGKTRDGKQSEPGPGRQLAEIRAR